MIELVPKRSSAMAYLIPASRIVVDLPAFLAHHLALGRDILLGQDEIGHPVGFDLHDEREPIPADLLVVGRIVATGDRIVLAAVPVHDVREFAGTERPRALEKKVLEEVGDPGLALRFVGRSHRIPHYVGDDWSTPIGDHRHLQAIVQSELARLDI